MYLQHLYPVPENIQIKEGCFVFGSELVMETDACLELAEQERIQTLFYQFTCTGATLKLLPQGSVSNEVRAVLQSAFHSHMKHCTNLI